jgi:hypothetical protein
MDSIWLMGFYMRCQFRQLVSNHFLSDCHFVLPIIFRFEQFDITDFEHHEYHSYCSKHLVTEGLFGNGVSYCRLPPERVITYRRKSPLYK